jgi:hypothetical protein
MDYAELIEKDIIPNESASGRMNEESLSQIKKQSK